MRQQQMLLSPGGDQGTGRRPDLFMTLPAETRNQVYLNLFPPGSRIVTSQRMIDIYHEICRRRAKRNASRSHPVELNGTATRYLLGILGTCRSIRQEAIGVFKNNVQGTFELHIAVNFKIIPPIIRNLIDEVVLVQVSAASDRDKYVLRFPNLKTFRIGTFVLTQWQLVYRRLEGKTGDARASLIASIEDAITEYHRINRRDFWRKRSQIPFYVAYENTPNRWILMSGLCPAAIMAQIYVVDDEWPGLDGSAHDGLLVEFDLNQGCVCSCEEVKFARRRDEEGNLVWTDDDKYLKDFWVMLDPDPVHSLESP